MAWSLISQNPEGVLTSFSSALAFLSLMAKAFCKDVKTPFFILLSTYHAINDAAKTAKRRKPVETG
ncbi:hypothetical protein BH20ACI4_BH20ACI4_18000 [soil metagenome]